MPPDKNFLDEEHKDKIHFLPRNLEEALDALQADNDFLKRGDIFDDALLQQWVKLKEDEIHAIGTMPHPFEYKMYYTLYSQLAKAIPMMLELVKFKSENTRYQYKIYRRFNSLNAGSCGFEEKNPNAEIVPMTGRDTKQH